MENRWIGKQDFKLLGESAQRSVDEVHDLPLARLQAVVAGARMMLIRTRAERILRLRAAFAVAAYNNELSGAANMRIAQLDDLIDTLEQNIDRAIDATVRGKGTMNGVRSAQRAGKVPKAGGKVARKSRRGAGFKMLGGKHAERATRIS